eukprot:5061473-Ditylum_brightwellii.AAC.1
MRNHHNHTQTTHPQHNHRHSHHHHLCTTLANGLKQYKATLQQNTMMIQPTIEASTPTFLSQWKQA